MTINSFWCERCKKDMDLPSVLAGESEKRFIGRCPTCRKELHRYVTYPNRDPYHRLSKRATIERQRLEIDLLQPNDPKFKQYYKAQWDEMEKKRDEFERTQEEERKKADEYYKKIAGYGGESRDMARKVREAEERLKNGNN